MGSLGDGGLQSLPLALRTPGSATRSAATSCSGQRDQSTLARSGVLLTPAVGGGAHSRAGNCGPALCTHAHPAVREVAMMPQPRRPRHSVHRGRGLAHRLLVGMIGDFAGQIAFGNSFPIALARH